MLKQLRFGSLRHGGGDGGMKELIFDQATVLNTVTREEG